MIRPVRNPSTMDDIRELRMTGPWRSKSGGLLSVPFALSHVQTLDIFDYDQAELDRIPRDIRGLRMFVVEDIPGGAIGGGEFHRISGSFPDHLKELAALLAEVEFGNLLLMGMEPDGSPKFFAGDLADPDFQRRLLSERWNFFGPTITGYRLSTYRRMPEGWAPAPPDVWSDLHMWRKFLRLDGITVDTRFTIQSLCLHNSRRLHMTLERRRDETERWMNIIRDPARRAAMVNRYWGSFMKAHVKFRNRLKVREQELVALRSKVAEFEAKITVSASSKDQCLRAVE